MDSNLSHWQAQNRPLDLSRFDDIAIDGVDLETITVVSQAGQVWRKPLGDGAEWVQVSDPWQDEGLAIKRPKVLAITPFHPAYGIRPQTWQSIGVAIAAYDGPIDWIISHNDNPHLVGFENVTYQHNKARAVFLAGDYDALLSIEADMIVPADAIQKLLDCNADVAYGLYVWRHGMERWSAYSDLGIFGGRSCSVPPNDARSLWGGIHDVKGIGMGCTLIKRRVLEHFPFRLYTGDKDDWLIEGVLEGARRSGVNINPYEPHTAMFCDDWLLALDAAHYGFTQRANFGLICGHIDHNKTWWPDIDSEKFVRGDAL